MRHAANSMWGQPSSSNIAGGSGELGLGGSQLSVPCRACLSQPVCCADMASSRVADCPTYV